MANTLSSTHDLENGLRLRLSDESREIAADRWVVRIRFEVAVPVADHYGSIPPEKAPPLPEILTALGPITVYQKVKERNFVSADDKEAILNGLVDAFMKDAAPYLGRATFPGKYILKAFRDNGRAIPTTPPA